MAAATVDDTSVKKFDDITKCWVCLKAFTDPRILPCMHTMCAKCLQELGEKSEKKPGENLPCPVCKKEFVIPADGVQGLQKNFFIENLMVVTAMHRLRGTTIPCVFCKTDAAAKDTKADLIPSATMRCLKCLEDMCGKCCKLHKQQKATKDHPVVKIESDVNEEEIRMMFPVMNCPTHPPRLLDFYCAECKKIVCVACFVESHKTHDCKDVTTVEGEFRQAMEKNSAKIYSYAGEMLSRKRNLERKKEEFIVKIAKRRDEILNRSQELKVLIEEHKKTLLEELKVIEQKHLTDMQNNIEDVDIRFTIMKSYDAYCTDLKSKGSASDICGGVDELHRRADELEKEHEQFLALPYPSVEVTFKPTDLDGFLQTEKNIVGKTEGEAFSMESFDFKSILLPVDKSAGKMNDKVNIYLNNEPSRLRQGLIWYEVLRRL